MKTALLTGILLTGAVVHADVLHLTTGQQIRGQVRSYANMNFEVQCAERGSIRVASATVKKIEFEGTTAQIESRTAGTLEGTVTRYESASFVLETKEKKTQTIALTMVKSAAFGGGAGKDIEQVRGSDLEKYLVAGQVTIVDFYADWCGPCRMIGPHLEKLAKDDDEVVLRKVNVDQNRTLAQKYKVRGIPHILIYDKQRKLVGTVIGANKTQIEGNVAKAKTAAE